VETVLWSVFAVVVAAMLAADLLVFHRDAHAVGRREALAWSVVWVAAAFLFCAGIYWAEGGEKAAMFLTGYLIEKSLSVDNLFVILLIFGYFGIPPRHQHRVLFWGILGALVMRALFIFAGLALVHALHWIIYVFGAFLVFSGVKMFFSGGQADVDPGRNPVLRLVRRFLPVTRTLQGQRFLARRKGVGEARRRWVATPLFVALVAIETTDLIFAVDSIPAILAISTDAFIVFTSNIFAILGLRALYFLLAGVMTSIRFLRPVLAAVLTFLGFKMALAPWVHVSTGHSLAVVFGLLAMAGLLSWIFPVRPDTGSPTRPAP
jgi:tellurite resistance protein TerC